MPWRSACCPVLSGVLQADMLSCFSEMEAKEMKSQHFSGDSSLSHLDLRCYSEALLDES